MTLESAGALLVAHPALLAVVVVFVFGCFALQSPPSFISLVFLLAITRLFLSVIITSKRAGVKLIFVVVSLAAATTVANISSVLNAVPEVQYPTAVLALFILALLASSLAISAIFFDTYLQWHTDCRRLPLFFFPVVWSTALLIASTTSPLGYLAIWTPVRGLSAYHWIKSILGPVGINWIVGAWAIVVAELLTLWFTEPAEQDDSLISTSSAGVTDGTEKSRKTPRLLYMVTFLCLGTIPYYFQDTLPTPVNSATTTPLSVACALPYAMNMTQLPNFDEFLLETKTLAGLAKVVLWPEGAVQFNSLQAKQEAVKKVAEIAAGSVIGVSFEEHTSDARGSMGRNGLMLVDRNGMAFEYFKRHLVPFVESNAMVANTSPPDLYEYQLVTKRNSRGKALESLTVPITGSICLDFAHPVPFYRLSQRPSLILGAARTWHPSIGVTMWEHAKTRAEEVGSAVLWCDGGEEGVSGVGGRGMAGGEIVQVGPGSWVRTIGLEVEANHRRTIYAFIGPWFSIAFIGLTLFAGRISEKVVQRIREGGDIGCSIQVDGLRKKVLDTYCAWKRGREVDEADETTHLL